MSTSNGKDDDTTTDHPLLRLKSNTVVTAADVIADTTYPKIVLKINANPESERQTSQAQKALGPVRTQDGNIRDPKVNGW